MSLRKICIMALTIFLTNAGYTQTTFTMIYGFPEVTSSTGATDPSNPPAAPPGITAQTFTAVGLSANSTAAGRFSFTGWPTGAFDGNDDFAAFTGALSPFTYYDIRLAPEPGFTLALTGLKFDVRRSGTGPRNFCVRGSDDDFTFNLAATTGTNPNLGVIPDDNFFWKFDGTTTSSDQRGCQVSGRPSLNHLTGEIVLRIFAWNAESPSGSFSIDNFSVEGTITTSVNPVSELTTAPCATIKQPGSGRISVNTSCENTFVRLSTITGTEIGSWTMLQNGAAKEIEVPPGLYVISIRGGDFRTNKKLLIR